MARPRLLFGIAMLLLVSSPTPGIFGGGEFCGALETVTEAAGGAEGFAPITGPDAGLYHETDVKLPGAKRCGVAPNECPDAAWRCLMQSEGKYIIAQQAQGKMVARVEACLGPNWSREDAKVEGYFRWTEFRRAGSDVTVRVTTSVSDADRRVPHRLVVGVFSPGTELSSP